MQQAAPFCEGFAEHLALVDLPGFGDINSVRNQIAERYYRKADSVCICTRLDRAATIGPALEWLHRVVRDLPSGSAFYVCTKSDDINKAEIIRAPRLPQSTTKMAVSCCATANLKDWLSNQGNASVLGIRISSERNVLL